ncbi:MAG: sigma-54-dependent Fis family transcriptional regulator [Deltaproteobacteria bacterium]|nr:sigma-54-dependent Fis family transcriptional regulator [Deltaproteobacteria bacterium]
MNILIVDDDELFRKNMSKAMIRRGYDVGCAKNGEDAVNIAAGRPFDMAFIDMKMPGMSGIDVIRELQEIAPELKSIVLTGYGSISNAVEAMKIGAYDYLIKPCGIEEIEERIRTIYQEFFSQAKDLEGDLEIYQGIVGNSQQVKKMITAIQKVKDYQIPVFICGESGTGKELAARALHFDSIRKGHQFVAINCASLKPELLENELFGHVKGAFTGATDNKDGLFKVADRGTLFIDEIGDMNLTVQASLLRFLETGIFRPLGSTKESKVDIRIIAAINKNIEEEVKAKRFRHDLYYRLNVCRIDCPCLRDRKEDIPMIARYFLLSSPLAKKRSIVISEDAMDLLMAYPWHGNIRELFNTLSRAILLSNSPRITKGLIKSILPQQAQQAVFTERKPSVNLKDTEKKHLLESLNTNGWNISRTAKNLGIDRRTLQRKIARYQIRP